MRDRATISSPIVATKAGLEQSGKYNTFGPYNPGKYFPRKSGNQQLKPVSVRKVFKSLIGLYSSGNTVIISDSVQIYSYIILDPVDNTMYRPDKYGFSIFRLPGKYWPGFKRSPPVYFPGRYGTPRGILHVQLYLLLWVTIFVPRRYAITLEYKLLSCIIVVISKLGNDLAWGRRYTSVQVNEDSSGLKTPESGISLGGYESKYRELSENL